MKTSIPCASSAVSEAFEATLQYGSHQFPFAACGSKKFKFQQLVEVGWRGIKLSDATVNFDHEVRRFISGIFAQFIVAKCLPLENLDVVQIFGRRVF